MKNTGSQMTGIRLDVKIIRVGASEIPLLYDLLKWRLTGPESEHPPSHQEDPHKVFDLEKMRANIKSDSMLVWAAEHKHRLVGYCSVAKILKPNGLVYFFIDELWVPTPFRRKGIALGLLREVIKVAQVMDMWRVRLTAADTNAALNLYRKAGFNVHEPSGWTEMEL
jgi:ribosomal protein S18 acetylase RimI-like enzyme